MQMHIQKFLKGDFQKVKLFIFVKFMIKQYYKSIGVKKRKQDVIAFVKVWVCARAKMGAEKTELQHFLKLLVIKAIILTLYLQN